MDHAINSLKPYYEAEMDNVVEEFSSGKYKKLSDCPSYPPAKALIRAIHTLEKFYYGEKKTMGVNEWVHWL